MAMVDVPGCDIPIRISHKELLYSDIMSYNKPPLSIEVRILQYIILAWAYTVVRSAV